MAKATDVRPKITMACAECKERNYITRKNRRNDPDRHRAEEVLPALRQAHRAPRDPLTRLARTRGRPISGRRPVVSGHALDQSFVGRTYPPTEPYQVGREKIREFADAIGATDAAYHDPAAAAALGYPDVVAPPTFPVVLTHGRPAGRSSTTRSSAWTTAGWSTATSGSRYTRPVWPATSWSA